MVNGRMLDLLAHAIRDSNIQVEPVLIAGQKKQGQEKSERRMTFIFGVQGDRRL